MDKFVAFIDFKDVVNCGIISIKEEIYLEVLMNSIGDCKNEIYSNKVKEYKTLNKPMACAFFKFFPRGKKNNLFDDLELLTDKINTYLDEKRARIVIEIPFSLTKIPFYDIIAQKEISSIGSYLHKKEQQILEKKEEEQKNDIITKEINKKEEKIVPEEEKNIKKPQEKVSVPQKIIPPDEYLPRSKEKSTILNPDQFHKLIFALPPVLKLCNWNLVYANMTHGTCFEVLFRLVGDFDYPNLLVIKDWKGNVFGAYFNEGWKRKKLFYGAGETFLYTFKNTNDLTVYSWTKRNNYFLLTNGECGICIGAGEYYGLYIYPDLTRGYSFPSETFNNDFLTNEKDFSIARLEVCP